MTIRDLQVFRDNEAKNNHCPAGLFACLCLNSYARAQWQGRRQTEREEAANQSTLSRHVKVGPASSDPPYLKAGRGGGSTNYIFLVFLVKGKMEP